MQTIVSIIQSRNRQQEKNQETYQKDISTLSEEDAAWRLCKNHVDSLPIDICAELLKGKPKYYTMAKSSRISRYLEPFYSMVGNEERKFDIEIIVYERKSGEIKLAEYVAWNNYLNVAYIREIVDNRTKDEQVD